jgi:hypothetical protein
LTNGLYTDYSGLTDERYTWRIEIKQGFWHEPYVLQQYRVNRDSNLWRSTREVEKLCEYILHLEGATKMSESIKTICDNCSNDISSSHLYPAYRLRLVEEMRSIAQPASENPESKPELDSMKNFCDKHCLGAWAVK